MTLIAIYPWWRKCFPNMDIGCGYHVYFDNFFTSVPLVQELARHRTLACGTVRMNRKELPADVKKTKLKVPGELLTRQSGNLLLTMWHDKRQVAVLSTNQNAGSIDITRRNGTVVSKHTAIANYNKHMGASISATRTCRTTRPAESRRSGGST